MSTIIERALRAAAFGALVMASAFALLLALPFVGARPVAVVGPTGQSVRAVLAAGGSIVEVRGGTVIARADPAALYAAGARLVVEARASAGCGGAAKAGA